MSEPAGESSSPPSATYVPSVRRTRLALALALAALAAALVGAIGPAEKVRTTYLWPPKTLPAGHPTRLSYSPLLLIRHLPESLVADLPCSPTQSLPKAARPLTVLASARHPQKAGGLAVRQVRRKLVFTIGEHTFERVRLTSAAPDAACAYRLRIGGGRWSLRGGVPGAERGGDLEAMPVVTGLFSGVDLRANGAPSIEVTTAVYATRTTSRQTLTWVLAALGIVAAMGLVTFERRPRRIVRSTRTAVAAAWRQARVVDAVVAVVLIGWWVLAPAAWDDGWVLARESEFRRSHGFSNYYDALGVNLPLDYWLEWLQHWVLQSSRDVLVLRFPTLACLCVAWVVCRWAMSRIRYEGNTGSTTPWVLATAYLAGALAWGMTLRPEPVTMLLATAVCACAVAFKLRPSTLPLTLAAILAPLALAAHQAGIVALAPLFVVAPDLWKWARRQRSAVLVIMTSSLALLLTLVSVGSDLPQRILDARITRSSGVATSPYPLFDELARYRELLGTSGLSIAAGTLIGLTTLMLVIRGGRSSSVARVPSWTLGAALALLVLTPSKPPEHLGALVGITSLAMASEAHRLGRQAEFARRLAVPPLIVIAALLVGIGYVWLRASSQSIELRSFDPAALSTDMRLATVMPLLLIALVAVAAFWGSGPRGSSSRFYAAPWRVASWSAPILVVPAIAFTLAVNSVNALRSSWTLARQNIQALEGNRGCGLADDARVSSRTTGRILPLSELIGAPGSRTLALPNTLLYFPCARLPSLRDGVADVPDYVISPSVPVSPSQPVSVRYTASPFYGLLDIYALHRLPWRDSHAPRQLIAFAVRRVIPDALEAPPVEWSVDLDTDRATDVVGVGHTATAPRTEVDDPGRRARLEDPSTVH